MIKEELLKKLEYHVDLLAYMSKLTVKEDPKLDEVAKRAMEVHRELKSRDDTTYMTKRKVNKVIEEIEAVDPKFLALIKDKEARGKLESID